MPGNGDLHDRLTSRRDHLAAEDLTALEKVIGVAHASIVLGDYGAAALVDATLARSTIHGQVMAVDAALAYLEAGHAPSGVIGHLNRRTPVGQSPAIQACRSGWHAEIARLRHPSGAGTTQTWVKTPLIPMQGMPR